MAKFWQRLMRGLNWTKLKIKKLNWIKAKLMDWNEFKAELKGTIYNLT